MLSREGLSKIIIVSLYTAKEVIKSKVLVNTFVIGIALFIITFVAYNFTYGEPARVALDFGLGALSLSTVAIAIFMGVGIISDEIQNRTVYLVVSRPVPRYAFLIGKLLGLLLVLLLNVIILSLITLSLYFFIGGEYQSLISWAIIFIGAEAVLMLLVVSCFSLVTSKVLSIILSIVVYIIGHAIDGVKLISFVKDKPAVEFLLDCYQFILPAFYKLNLKNYVLYEQNLSLTYLLGTLFYALLYGIALMIISITIFEKKNLD